MTMSYSHAVRAAIVMAVATFGASLGAQQAPRASIIIPRVDAPPRLEDYLSGEQRPGVHITGFLQRNPGDLAPPSEQTDAYLSYDATNLYAVFVCRAVDPSRVRARVSRRDKWAPRQVWGPKPKAR